MSRRGDTGSQVISRTKRKGRVVKNREVEGKTRLGEASMSHPDLICSFDSQFHSAFVPRARSGAVVG